MDKLQKLAIGLTHLIYRNTAIEDMHSANAKMNQEFYDDGYLYFKQIMEIADKNKDIYKMFLAEGDEKQLTKKLNDPNTTSEAKEIISTIFFYSINSEWDTPTLCNDTINNNKTDYMLKGKFKEHCDTGSFLNDKVMCDINKDVCNRIYTLLYKGFFD